MMKLTALVWAMLFAAALFAAVDVKVADTRADALHRSGENAVFRIRVLENKQPVTSGQLTVALTWDGLTPVSSQEFDLAKCDGSNIEVKGTMNKPGFLYCTVTFRRGREVRSQMAAAGFDVEKIRLAAPCPADFDAFWDNALKEVAATPADFKIEKMEALSTAKSTAYRLSVAAPGGRVYGFLRVPAGKGPFPLSVNVPGAGPSVTAPGAEGNAPIARLVVNVHNYDPLDPAKTSQQAFNELQSRGHYAYRDLADRRKHYFYRAILGVSRMIDLVAARPEIDAKRIVYSGSSQGGGFGIILAGLVPGRFRRVVSNITAMCDRNGYLAGRFTGWPDMNADGKWSEAELANAAYFDAGNFARRITDATEVVMISGFSDRLCGPSSIRAAYNSLGTKRKKIYNEIGMGHNTWSNYLNEIKKNDQSVLK